MDSRTSPEYILEVFADQILVKDIVKGERVFGVISVRYVDMALQAFYILSSSIATSLPFDPP